MKRIIDKLSEKYEEFEYEIDGDVKTIYIPLLAEREMTITKYKSYYQVNLPPKKHFDLPVTYTFETEEQVIEKLGLND